MSALLLPAAAATTDGAVTAEARLTQAVLDASLGPQWSGKDVPAATFTCTDSDPLTLALAGDLRPMHTRTASVFSRSSEPESVPVFHVHADSVGAPPHPFRSADGSTLCSGFTYRVERLEQPWNATTRAQQWTVWSPNGTEPAFTLRGAKTAWKWLHDLVRGHAGVRVVSPLTVPLQTDADRAMPVNAATFATLYAVECIRRARYAR
jgi:hypothetical protein